MVFPDTSAALLIEVNYAQTIKIALITMEETNSKLSGSIISKNSQILEVVVQVCREKCYFRPNHAKTDHLHETINHCIDHCTEKAAQMVRRELSTGNFTDF